MQSTTSLVAVAIITLAVVSQYNVLEASFYDNALIQSLIGEKHEFLPACLTLPDAKFHKLLIENFATHPSVSERRKRSVNFMRRVDDESDRDADRATVASDLAKLLSKMSQHELNTFKQRVVIACAAVKAARCLFALRRFLGNESMDEKK